jgi:NADP-dependent 3-hydroxy acid dehydrogenase YdfG
MPLDVTDDESVAALSAAVTDVFVVFNNAGVAGGTPLLTTPLSETLAVLDTNVVGRCASPACSRMRWRGTSRACS